MKREGQVISILDPSFVVEGRVDVRGELIVRGTIRGRLVGERVIIAEEGCVHAEADVSRMIVAGEFKGTVRASEKLAVLKTGRCAGEVVCGELSVEAGAIVDAGIRCRDDGDEVPKRNALPPE